MSIPNLIYKIKSKTNIDKETIMYLCVIVGVGISSFCLGRISLNNNFKEDNNKITTGTENLLKNQNIKDSEILVTQSIQSTEKRYVASKNGKMYYSVGCSGAKRIKPDNEVWFGTREDAEKSGYTMSSTCK